MRSRPRSPATSGGPLPFGSSSTTGAPPPPSRGAADRAPGPDPDGVDDVVDLTELTDATDAPATGVDVVSQIFPGAEEVDG